ncbi:MAG TPA: thioesterase family protein [Aldersonia sp.]
MSTQEHPAFHTKVEVRWSDMDAFQHINHARMVTLLEEARIPWLFAEGRPTLGLRDGCVIVDVHVRYRGQLRHEDTPLDVAMWIMQLRAVDFTIGYEVRAARSDPALPPAVEATTHLAAFDIGAQRLRRLTPPEREFLAWYRRG